MSTLPLPKRKRSERLYSSEDFDDERVRRTMFSSFHKMNHPTNLKFPLAEQFLVVGTHKNNDTPQILFKFPDYQIQDFSETILVEYCFPDVVKKTKVLFKTQDSFNEISKSLNLSHKSVANYFTLYFTGTHLKSKRFAHCITKQRLFCCKVDEQDSSFRCIQDDIVFVLLTQSEKHSLSLSFIESLLDFPEINEMMMTDFLPTESQSHLELHLTEFFNHTSDISIPLKLDWKDTPLPNKQCLLCQCLFLNKIPIKDLVILTTATLLEKKVFILSPYRDLVSSTLSFLIQSVSPFKYEFPVIPVLTKSTFDLIDSPTPLVIGLTTNCFTQTELPENSVVYNITTKRFTYAEKLILPNFPNFDIVCNDIEKTIQPLKKFIPHSVEECAEKHSEVIVWAIQRIEMEMRILLVDFEEYCITNRSGKGTTSLFMADQFISGFKKDSNFVQEVVKTQMFANWAGEQLEEIDEKKRAAVLNNN
ncbi:hypothetical protein EIN_132330 [Entamoeba invadens IP1]|uniref:UDENN domain-containing protein n=1 Tax=Entamoeba invadens IP1 TaxID=370355 RepID=A0A0A1UDD3_ENTIV|nr:hypothetical protein EIN_132330 [Entamoeba invadens IP1]ELP94354.1 hypothetical protein EIN_132330 [Entamoeba invadens IP1]|eukprot:XP_004261125.1 hypothetical protein EIN_132330 [Entamoeba invadens IP1]